MMLLTKLKAAAVAVAVAVAAAGGVGMFPAARADDKPAEAKPAAKPALGPKLGDREFLTQTCLTLRGDLPTDVEMSYFLADPDPAKRKKMVNWLADGEPTTASDGTWHKRLLVSGRTCQSCHDVGSLNALLRRGSVTFAPDGKTLVADGRLYDLAVTDRLNVNDIRPWLVAGGTHDGVVRVWDLDAADHSFWAWKQAGAHVDADDYATLVAWILNEAAAESPDAAFLRRVCTDLRGTGPTRIELAYFLADADPKKREKVLDLLAQDPAVAKKLAADWKKKYLTEPTAEAYHRHKLKYYRVAPRARLWMKYEPPSKHEALLGQLLEAKKPDDQVLDALAAAALGRLPTDSERKLILAQIGKAADKAAAWREVLATLADTDEAKKRAEPPKK